jgi:hypothetical protein
MKRIALFVIIAMLTLPLALAGQSPSLPFSSSSLPDAESDPYGGGGQVPSPVKGSSSSHQGLLSEIGVGAAISPLGIQLQAATNLSNHFNLRGTGNFFTYTANFSSSGINASANLNLASAGLSLDVYPFRSGFRVSPGLLFYNQNQITATTVVPAGSSFTLNGTTYYSANTNLATGATPVLGTATLGFNTAKPGYTVTTGWGNILPRTRHWSVPFEVGIAYDGAPTLKVNLGGWACYDQAQTECTNISSPTDPIAVAIQSNLNAQIVKWTSDLAWLKTYPIISVGVAYSFHIR